MELILIILTFYNSCNDLLRFVLFVAYICVYGISLPVLQFDIIVAQSSFFMLHASCFLENGFAIFTFSKLISQSLKDKSFKRVTCTTDSFTSHSTLPSVHFTCKFIIYRRRWSMGSMGQLPVTICQLSKLHLGSTSINKVVVHKTAEQTRRTPCISSR